MDQVYIDKASGKKHQPARTPDLLAFVRKGDTVIVESISRFARNTRDLLDLVNDSPPRAWSSSPRKRPLTPPPPQGSSCSLFSEP